MKFGDKPESFDIDDNISCCFGFWVLFSDFPDVSVSECFIFLSPADIFISILV